MTPCRAAAVEARRPFRMSEPEAGRETKHHGPADTSCSRGRNHLPASISLLRAFIISPVSLPRRPVVNEASLPTVHRPCAE